MSVEELGRIVGKARELRELQRARAHVRQLERELRGEPVKPREPSPVPEFLTQRIVRGVSGARE